MLFKQFMNEPAKWVIGIAGLLATLFGVLNSTLIFDDPFLYEHFGKILADLGFIKSLGVLFLNLDLHVGVPEYRTYGLSKVLHFFLWLIFDANAWMYSAFIGLSQVATALLFYSMCRRWNVGALQSLLLALVWLLSPFAVTTCFHHYSYLILPVQITLVTVFFIQRWMESGKGGLWPSVPFLILAGICIGLTGELHLFFAVVVLGLVFHKSGSVMNFKQRLNAFALIVGSMFMGIAVHRAIWSLLGASVDVQRFNYSVPTFSRLLKNSSDYVFSLPKGAGVQLEQIIGYSPLSATVFVLVTAGMCVLLHFIWKRGWGVQSERENGASGNRLVTLSSGMLLLLVASAFGVVWIHAISLGQVGEVLSRRYGYVPYTLACMALVCFLFDLRIRMRLGVLPALFFVSAVAGLWAALQLVCLPQVRSQDELLWGKIQQAIRGKSNPHVLFANSSSSPRPTGFDSPGIRSTKFPPLFESPFVRYGWQGQYLKVALGVKGTGDQFEPGGNSTVVLNGQLESIHFLASGAITVPEESLVVVMDRRHVIPAWRDGMDDVEVLSSWAEFKSTPAYLRIKIEAGWGGFISGVFNDPREEVAIDLGQKALTQVPGLLPDKAFDAPVISKSIVLNYGLESGDDSVYSPNGNSGAPLSYFSTNRHGTFTYRIEFLDTKPKLVSIDFMDVWAGSPGHRVLALQVALGEKWVDLGVIDTFGVAGREPFSLKIPVADVSSIRIRFKADPSSKDIPFANGIRVKALAAG